MRNLTEKGMILKTKTIENVLAHSVASAFTFG